MSENSSIVTWAYAVLALMQLRPHGSTSQDSEIFSSRSHFSFLAFSKGQTTEALSGIPRVLESA